MTTNPWLNQPDCDPFPTEGADMSDVRWIHPNWDPDPLPEWEKNILLQAEIDRLEAENVNLVAAVRERDAEIERLRKNHADLTSRMGFGDGVTEPQADNDTIMRAWDEMSSQSMEWLESEAWRTDCYLAGHPDTEDCYEHDPSLRLLNAEAALARVEVLAADLDSWPSPYRGMPVAAEAIRAALAGEGE